MEHEDEDVGEENVEKVDAEGNCEVRKHDQLVLKKFQEDDVHVEALNMKKQFEISCACIFVAS